MSNEFRKARDILAGIEAAKRRAADEMARKCDWDDPEDVALLKREDRLKERLDSLPENRVCPACGQTRPRSRQWVVNKRGDFAVCKVCFSRSWYGDHQTTHAVSILEDCPRYRLKGSILVQLREERGVSCSEFARRAGWSRQNQARLERSDQLTIERDTAETILQVLSEAGVETLDCL